MKKMVKVKWKTSKKSKNIWLSTSYPCISIIFGYFLNMVRSFNKLIKVSIGYWQNLLWWNYQHLNFTSDGAKYKRKFHSYLIYHVKDIISISVLKEFFSRLDKSLFLCQKLIIIWTKHLTSFLLLELKDLKNK